MLNFFRNFVILKSTVITVLFLSSSLYAVDYTFEPLRVSEGGFVFAPCAVYESKQFVSAVHFGAALTDRVSLLATLPLSSDSSLFSGDLALSSSIDIYRSTHFFSSLFFGVSLGFVDSVYSRGGEYSSYSGEDELLCGVRIHLLYTPFLLTFRFAHFSFPTEEGLYFDGETYGFAADYLFLMSHLTYSFSQLSLRFDCDFSSPYVVRNSYKKYGSQALSPLLKFSYVIMFEHASFQNSMFVMSHKVVGVDVFPTYSIGLSHSLYF